MKKSFILFVFLLCSIVVVAQKKSITGIITDTAGEAVIGASIVEVGTTNGTVSDVDGNFTLSVSDNASIPGFIHRFFFPDFECARKNEF